MKKQREFVLVFALSMVPVLLYATRCLNADERQPGMLIVLDGTLPGRTFEGIGAVSAGASSRLLIDYPEPYRSEILNYLFKPNYGAAFQHLKVEIGGDINSADGVEPSHMHARNDENYDRGYEWWLMEQAKARNPRVILDALEWGAPGWIGNGEFFSQDNADYIVKFVQGAKQRHRLTIDYVGIWNEMRYKTEWIKVLKKTLRAHGLTTKIVAPDLTDTWGIIDAMESDPALRNAIDAIGVHYPGHINYILTGFQGRPSYRSTLAAQHSGKPLWASEDGPWRGDWKGAEELAKMYNRNYIDARITKTEIWSPVTAYYDNLDTPGSGVMRANTPWTGHYEVQPALWATAHTTQFVQPGWQYIDSACGYLRRGGSYVTLKSPSGRDYSIILETVDAGETQAASFKVIGGLSTGVVHVWRTTSYSKFIRLADITPVGGMYTVTLDPDSIYSLTTIAGQSKGSAVAPKSAAFPLPYNDDFESYRLGTAPKYFTDQSGVFQISKCSERSGQCLRQVLAKKGIAWMVPNPDPITVVGSLDWANYHVSADVFLPKPGYVSLLGRIGVILHRPKRGPDSYELSVRDGGAWKLNAYTGGTKTVLLSGHTSFSTKSWHKLELQFRGSTIEALIDGQPVGHANDANHLAGMVGLGSNWTQTEFDNFHVQPLN